MTKTAGVWAEVARILEEYEAELGDYVLNASDPEEEELLKERHEVVAHVRTSYLAEFGQTQCYFCAATVEAYPKIPLLDDDEGWAKLAEEHEPWCEWIKERAHRKEGR